MIVLGGAVSPLNLTSTAGSITINADLQSSSGNAFTLDAASNITTQFIKSGGSPVAFLSNLTAGNLLTINNFNATEGSLTAISGGLTTVNGSFITNGGDVNITSNGGVLITTNMDTAAGDISITNSTVGLINFNPGFSTTSGNVTLTNNANVAAGVQSGFIDFGSDITTDSGNVTIQALGDGNVFIPTFVTNTGDFAISATSGSILFDGQGSGTNLSGSGNFSASTVSGDITFTAPITAVSGSSLSINSGGSINMSGAVNTNGGSFSASGLNAVFLSTTFNTSGGDFSVLATNGNMDLIGPQVSTSGGNIVLTSQGSGFVHTDSILDAGSGDITITTDNDAFIHNSVTGTGSLLIQPFTAGTSIDVGNGGGSQLIIDSGAISLFNSALSSVTIGSAGGQSAITIGSGFTLNTDFVLQADTVTQLSGDTVITAVAVGLDIQAIGNIDLNNIDGLGNILLSSSTGSVLLGAVDSAGLSVISGNDISINALTGSIGDIVLQANNDVNVLSGGNIRIALSGNAIVGNVFITADADGNGVGNLNTDAGTLIAGQDITVSAVEVNDLGSFNALSGAPSITLSSSAADQDAAILAEQQATAAAEEAASTAAETTTTTTTGSTSTGGGFDSTASAPEPDTSTDTATTSDAGTTESASSDSGAAPADDTSNSVEEPAAADAEAAPEESVAEGDSGTASEEEPAAEESTEGEAKEEVIAGTEDEAPLEEQPLIAVADVGDGGGQACTP